MTDAPPLGGIFAVKFAVSDLARSRAWYERVFGVQPLFEFPDDDGTVRGVAYSVPGQEWGLALRENPETARAGRGHNPVVFALTDDAQLEQWVVHLEALEVPHERDAGTLGWVLAFHDPDGVEIHLYSRQSHGLTTGRPGSGRAVT